MYPKTAALPQRASSAMSPELHPARLRAGTPYYPHPVTAMDALAIGMCGGETPARGGGVNGVRHRRFETTSPPKLGEEWESLDPPPHLGIFLLRAH